MGANLVSAAALLEGIPLCFGVFWCMRIIQTSKFDTLINNHKDRLKGGLADNKHPKEFDRDQLEKGWKVEKEHTDDDALALEISMDHLCEDKAYYDKLEKMENGKSPKEK